MQTLARQDIRNGDGVCVIDPHGDLVEDILEYVPKERAKDIVFFDAWDEERPMWLNLYEIDNIDEADRVVNDATEIFIKMFGPEIFGPRIQEYFKYGSLTIMEDFEDRPTILDVVRLYTDEAFREYKVSKVKMQLLEISGRKLIMLCEIEKRLKLYRILVQNLCLLTQTDLLEI